MPENKFYKNKQHFASENDELGEDYYCTRNFYLNTNSADYVDFNKQVLFRME